MCGISGYFRSDGERIPKNELFSITSAQEHRGQRKRILYKVAQRYFPNFVLGRQRKHGFDIPLGELLRQGRLPEIADVLSLSRVNQEGILRADTVAGS